MLEVAQIVSLLHAKHSGNAWIAKCPVHDDQTESLTIRQGDKAALLKCHRGCPNNQIVEEINRMLGRPVRNEKTFPTPPKAGSTSAKKVVATYDYVDAAGNLLYQKLRFDPKDFRIRKPNGSGWDWSLTGVNEVLYNLPAINQALFSGETIFIVEGEKDADNISKLGFVATTNTHGASKEETRSKWKHDLSKSLQGASEVVILPDNDSTGNAHANSVAASLHQFQIPVKIVRLPGLPEKGDASDFLAAGGTKEQIISLAESAPFVRPDGQTAAPGLSTLTVAELMNQHFVAPRWAIEDLLPEGLTLLTGAPKMGKSWMSLQIALAVSRGEKVLGDFLADKGEVLYLALEDSFRRLQQRVSILADDSKLVDNKNLIMCTELEGMENGGVTALESFLESHPNCRLVIIDTLPRFVPPPETKANAYQNDYKVYSKLQKLAIKHRIALVGVQHLRKAKASGGDQLDEVSGSAGATGAADTIWVLKRQRTESTGSLMITGRDVDEKLFDTEFNKDTCKWSLGGDNRGEQRRKTLVQLTTHFGSESFTYASVVDALGMSLTNSKRLVGDLVSASYVVRLKEKIGRAFQFKLTDRMTDVVLGGAEDE